MIRLLTQLQLFVLTLFAHLPVSSKACLVCCGRHAATSFLRLPLPASSTSTILFDTNAAAALDPYWKGQGQQNDKSCKRNNIQQQLMFLDVSDARLDDATIIDMEFKSSSSYVHTDWKQLLARKDLFLLSNLGENDKDKNVRSDSTPPLPKNEEGVNKVEGENNNNDNDDENKAQAEEETQEEEETITMTTAMVASIGFYKRFISPLLPPACRFFPTCSQYGVQAIKEFGPCQGGLLTAWRLLRCSPFGGKGYDPPKWPPVPYKYSSY